MLTSDTDPTEINSAETGVNISRQVRHLLFRLALFILPIFILAIVALAVSIYVGDAMPIPVVNTLQNQAEWELFSVRVDDQFAYRVNALRQRKPDIVAVGSSRALGFRSMLFNENSQSFFNAGMPTANPAINYALLDALSSDDMPEIVIWTLDHHWFNADYERWFPEFKFDEEITITRLVEGSQRVWRILQQGKTEVLEKTEPIYGRSANGIEAILNGIGYRNDGSSQWSTTPDRSVESRFAREVDTFDNRSEHFTPGDAISEERLNEFAGYLSSLQNRGVTVIGILPPYAPFFYNQMLESGEYGYLDILSDELTEVFAQAGMPFYDFTDVQPLGATDDDMVDGWHASESLTAEMYLEILRDHPDILGAYSDPEFIQSAIDTSENQFDLFGEQF